MTIRSWATQAKRDDAKSPSDLSLSEHDELTRLRRESKRLRVEHEALAKAAAQKMYSITTMCRPLRVFTSGYHAWIKRPPLPLAR